MNNRRIAVAGLGILAAASLSLTACETTATPIAGSSASPGTPTAGALAPSAALVAALGKLTGQGFDVKITQDSAGSSGTGSIDPTNKSVAIDEKGTIEGQSLEINIVDIGTNLWAKVNLGALSSQLGIDPAKWMLIDQTKITSTDATPLDLTGPDALDLAGLFTSVTNVTATDATHLSGTIDLSAATGVNAPDSDALTKAGAAAKATPFTVTLDDQGRPTDIKITSTNPDLSNEITFTNFGSPSAITAPAAADVVPAPASLYSVFNGS